MLIIFISIFCCCRVDDERRIPATSTAKQIMSSLADKQNSFEGDKLSKLTFAYFNPN